MPVINYYAYNHMYELTAVAIVISSGLGRLPETLVFTFLVTFFGGREGGNRVLTISSYTWAGISHTSYCISLQGHLKPSLFLCSSIFSTYLLHITLSVNFNELDWHRTSHYLAQRKYSALPNIKPAPADYKKCIPLLINTTSLPQSCKIKIFLDNINHSALHGPTWACAVKSLLVSSPGLAALICVLPLRELVLDAASLYILARRKIILGAKLVWEKRKGETTQLYSDRKGKKKKKKKKKTRKKKGKPEWVMGEEKNTSCIASQQHYTCSAFTHSGFVLQSALLKHQ